MSKCLRIFFIAAIGYVYAVGKALTEFHRSVIQNFSKTNNNLHALHLPCDIQSSSPFLVTRLVDLGFYPMFR